MFGGFFNIYKGDFMEGASMNIQSIILLLLYCVSIPVVVALALLGTAIIFGFALDALCAFKDYLQDKFSKSKDK